MSGPNYSPIITALDVINIRDPVASIAVLNNLTSVNSIYISETHIVDLTGLVGIVETSSSSVFISNNDFLESTIGLSSLNSVGENLSITQNPLLGELTLDSLEEVGGFFHMWENTSLCEEDVFSVFDSTIVGNGTAQWGNTGLCP